MASGLTKNLAVGDSDNTLLQKLVLIMNEVADSVAAIDGSHSNVGVYTSSSGPTFTAMPPNVADSFRVVNDTGTAIEFRLGSGGATEKIPALGSNTYPCVDNTEEWQWRRVDAGASVTITGVFQK